jgi:nicotinate-nucleotide pyrophosphorylase (carboxylating)
MDLDALIDRALAEDVGSGDLAAEATVPPDAGATATITQKAPGVVFGLDLAEAVFARLDPGVRFHRLGPEAEWREPPAPVLAIRGSARALLTAERTALNLLQRLSGVATLTARHVRAIAGAGGTARVIDTRKTTPGLRALEKAAVVAGGGLNHRVGLYDGIIVKENHAAAAGGLAAAVRRAQAHVDQLAERAEAFGPESRWAGLTRPPIEVEVRDPTGDRRSPRSGRRAPPARQHVARAGPRCGRPDRRPGDHRGVGRHRARDNFGLCDH